MVFDIRVDHSTTRTLWRVKGLIVFSDGDAPRIKPSGLSRATISSYAEDVAKAARFEPGDALELLISDLGGTVEYSPAVFTGTADPESIIVVSDADFRIILGTMTSPGRDRFTMAHELGHYFVHYPLFKESFPNRIMTAQRWIDHADKEQQRAEWEANWFASAFLMPEASFRDASRRCSSFELAKLFGVSNSAVATRKKILGMVDEPVS